jgi:hypothetical protein
MRWTSSIRWCTSPIRVCSAGAHIKSDASSLLHRTPGGPITPPVTKPLMLPINWIGRTLLGPVDLTSHSLPPPPPVPCSERDFCREYQGPILRGREPDATDKERDKGEAKSAELGKIVNQFILRRTNTLLSKHLPPKLVCVVCCSMSALQLQASSWGCRKWSSLGEGVGRGLAADAHQTPARGPSVGAQGRAGQRRESAMGLRREDTPREALAQSTCSCMP